jgi:DNA-binding CsgD family transcriptional regulator
MAFSRKLTRTEKLVSDKILLGFTRIELAEIFKCSVGQISRMMGQVYGKLGVSTRDEFMALRIANLEDLLHKNGIEYD